ncbi:triphosphoribosyl-dephospho-CoA synthase MdcB [Methylobacterium longum]|uniref:Probable 2-(5''-triphosphoribosyl)-3'-dephosphocoenzyme-A synthase n=1 Tax=Methylobacterium longum TaxID=767694 RepID=A0ABT8AM20_9HYPH|nr:triphosphoribosyl-dephospho-CoA synthase MdcB [Methylobacterium longum]MCJ2101684.1 triphosphoribosyl-dephospho-CoA synthase MdcB [Methylobacterium sp. E-046]MDN3570611.1 triphosphoribosyl-dephospho-CoA synthase MdcB [Methylobacterium longum]
MHPSPAPARDDGQVARDDGWPRQVASLAHDALIAELETWPKPGLVSPVDSGSHDDMDAGTLRASAAAIRPFFADLVAAGTRGATMEHLRAIGLEAEAAMMDATDGVNAHRGAIFSLGLICAAAGVTGDGPCTGEALALAVGRRWGPVIGGAPTSPTSHGGRAARRYGVGGASAEAAAGFPTVRVVGLPALRLGRTRAPMDPVAARVDCFFALLAVVDDTNLLHRGGTDGLNAARAAASVFAATGGVSAAGWRDRALDVHRAFVAARLSPGGCADLLATTLLLDALENRA